MAVKEEGYVFNRPGSQLQDAIEAVWQYLFNNGKLSGGSISTQGDVESLGGAHILSHKAEKYSLDSEIARAKAVELELLKMIKGEEGEILIDGAKEIDIRMEGESISFGESKRVACYLRTWYGKYMTEKVSHWKIERQSSDPASDAVWNVSEKARQFAEQHYVEEAVIYLTWTNDEHNDLDPNDENNVTRYLVTAYLDKEEYQAYITWPQ